MRGGFFLPAAEPDPTSRRVAHPTCRHAGDPRDPRKLGHDAGALVAKAQAEGNKLALRQQVEHAASLGIFGAPTFITEDGEMFWGHDRMIDAFDWAVRGGHA